MKTEDLAIALLRELREDNLKCDNPLNAPPISEVWTRTERKIAAAVDEDSRKRAIAWLWEQSCLGASSDRIFIGDGGSAFLAAYDEKMAAAKTEERRHREIVRVAKVSAWIAAASAMAAIWAAWFAKAQADSAALSARPNLSTTPPPPAIAVPPSQKSELSSAATGTATAPPKKP